jgi:hypothetical protein
MSKTNIKSFYVLNKKFNEQAVSLYENEEKKYLIGKYIKLIKENKILKEQYELFSQLEEGTESFIVENKLFAKEYFNEILKPFEKYSKEEIHKNNEIVYNFMKENNLIGDEKIINEDKLSSLVEFIIYDDGSNTGKIVTKKLEAINELKIKKENSLVNETKTVEEKIKEFNEKYKGTLTNEEMDVLKSLITCTKDEKPEMLKEYQKNVVNNINQLIKEASDIELKEKYLQLKEQILFDDDVIQLFEINKLIKEIKN